MQYILPRILLNIIVVAIVISVCTKAQWTCSPLTIEKIPTHIEQLCPNNTVYSECISNCPKTCKSLDEESAACDETNCKSGCQCVEGFVLEGDQCIETSMCPCYYGGKAYHEGDIISMDCNQW